MSCEPISVQELALKSISIWDDQWFVLTAGDFEKKQFNSMTVSWGSIGIIWRKPFVQVVVRPTRYTFGFIESFPDFTVCTFPEDYRQALQLLGTISGRDLDKISAAKITPVKSQVVAAPCFDEANLIIECRKIYSEKFTPLRFLSPEIEKCYEANDYHTSYFGEIMAIRGDRSLYTR
jgi:flavin reductase (DIM6/NTAB) family NADH-FMN oxidoreductase RutF